MTTARTGFLTAGLYLCSLFMQCFAVGYPGSGSYSAGGYSGSAPYSGGGYGSGSYGSGGDGFLQRPQPRPRFDLQIPSYAYVPEKYTGHMQYLPNQPIYAAEGTGPYVGLWTLYQNDFRDVVPSEPVFDPVYQDVIAYIDGHPVTAAPGTTLAPVTEAPVATLEPVTGVPVLAPSTGLPGAPVAPGVAPVPGARGKNRISVSAETLIPEGRACVSKPSSATFRMGVCVPNARVTEVCVGKLVTKTLLCGQSSSCCMDSALSSSLGDLVERSRKLVTTTKAPAAKRILTSAPVLAPVEAEKIITNSADSPLINQPMNAFKTCRSPRGGFDFGICVNDALVGILCKNRFVARSPSCAQSQSCCVDGIPPESESTTEVTAPAATTTLPTTVAKRPAMTLCDSNLNPFSSGICVADNFLGQLCVDQFISKSRRCSATQSCCVDPPPASLPRSSLVFTEHGMSQVHADAAVSFSPNHFMRRGNIIPPRNIRVKSRMPATRARTKVSCTATETGASGLCVDAGSVISACSGKVLAEMSDCGTEQICCVDPVSHVSGPKKSFQQALPDDESQVSDITTTEISSAFLPCKSPDDPFSSGICVDSERVDQLCGTRTVSSSDDCFSFQLCCVDFMSIPQRRIPVRPLRPKQQLTVEAVSSDVFTPCSMPDSPFGFGVCVPINRATALCTGKRTSTSRDCTNWQICCADNSDGTFGSLRSRPVEFTTKPPTTFPVRTRRKLRITAARQPFEQCTPIIRNFDAGVCVREDQVIDLCTGRLVAPSRDCNGRQSCCSYFPNIPDAATLRATIITTTEMAEADTTSVAPSPRIEATSTEPSSDSFFRPCVASELSSKSSAFSFGVCVQESLAMDYCSGKVLSRSEDCAGGQLCCTNADQK